MGKKSSKAPDYKGAAEATAQSNAESIRDQTWANRADQYGPEGSLKWTAYQDVDPASGKPITRWRQDTSLSPKGQEIYDKQLGIQGKRMDVGGIAADRLKGEYGKSIDWGGVNPWGTAANFKNNGNTVGGPQNIQANSGQPGDPNAFRQQGEDAAYQSQMRRIDPQYKLQTEAMQQQLRNQGLNPDDRAWQNQMKAMSDSYNDASQSARLSASEAGRAESALNWGQGQDRVNNRFRDTSANMGYAQGNRAQDIGLEASRGTREQTRQQQQFDQANALRQQQMVEKMQKRGFNLNEINAMVSGQQVGMPQFGGYNAAGNAGGVDYTGAAQDTGNYNAANNQSFWGGLGSLANTGVKAYSAGMFG